ncbi:hypothetical protein SISNIDRAFT_303444 [Sistotremastrum niveocremeum HHB9708]|uniref:Nonmuscle myosin heavy chain b n=1 Tax=Sistotremastrum niveocremeum HHB9708 TaxID=1314777 RepID=A0A164N4F0_9AGAM|nr:hypothetical protein SISNIDRAFT_303444 [Sistotremastrum niveocremeum HHB9708]
MPVARPSQAADAARAAEFNEKKWVWVLDDKEGYAAGWVNREEGNEAEVVMAVGGEIRIIPFDSLWKMNPPKFDRVDDIADLTYLNEASVVHNLRLRYTSGDIYTYSGLFLVAINPYTNLPIYSDATILQYRSKRRDDNPPHIFAVAERAWVNMGEQRENQSILVTGESGAGKTENTKKVIQYLAAIATHAPSSLNHSGLPRSDSSSSLIRSNTLSHQILQANPILEAFGNAQTARNNNSSRFGKFIRISFAHDGSIAGATIDWYLLEKSRVIARSEIERSFHVFYQLLEGGGTLRDALLLDGGVDDYQYLNKSSSRVDGVDDRSEFQLLKTALNVVGFSTAEQLDLFRVIAAILHIGNIEITAASADQAQILGTTHEKACHLLGISMIDFSRAVTRPQVLAGREWVTHARTKAQAQAELGALCKSLYEKMFGALVDRVNRALERPNSKATFIGVLDIAGFEIFENNGFEQLCINYTNEKLQQFFNHHMFVLEKEEYQREHIEWEFGNFGLDLQPTIDLIESSSTSIGVFSCLDEECIMPKATDATFTQKLDALWAGDVPDGTSEAVLLSRDKYRTIPIRLGGGFTICHYAGDVDYRTDGWLEKNKDPLNDNLTRVMAASTDKYIASLFAEYRDSGADPTANGLGPAGRKRILKKGAFRTVSQRHKEQLASLMMQLQATQPHFVRCIVPNGMKKPLRVDVPLVLDQLRCNGVLEGIRIARLGYPNRLPFVEFRQRYEVLTPGIMPPGYMDGRKACVRMVEALDLDQAFFKIGTSKIFFKAGVLAELEERRDGMLYDVFARFQAMARKFTARRAMKKILNRAVAIRTIQRNARIYGELREWPWWQLYTKVRPLLAATRNDEELRRKNAELLHAKERAERDQREKEALETLKMRLEQEKHKVEEDLEAERLLGVDKDALLERSKQREAELEEEILTLQADIETLDSQLDRAMEVQKSTEGRYETLKASFDLAADHLAKFENEGKEWSARELELQGELDQAQATIEAQTQQREDLEKISAELRLLVAEREEDLARAKERNEKMIAELEGKLAVEIKQREFGNSKADSLEQDARKAKAQLAELTRTATDYSNMIQRKEAEIGERLEEIEALRREHDASEKQNVELQLQLDRLTEEYEMLREDQKRESAAKAKLQNEIDELRTIMAAKVSEDTRREEVQRSKEEELRGLRSRAASLQDELSETRRVVSEVQARSKAELDSAQRDFKALEQRYNTLVVAEKGNEQRRKALETSLAESEKAKRALESELQSLRTRNIDTERQVIEAGKAKEALERQLVAAQAKYQDFEDAVLQIEREKASWARQMDSLKKQLDTEASKRAQLEQTAHGQKAELIKLRDRAAKQEKELNKALDDIHEKDWQVKQLVSKQDKTIVEHVHVLEEAKRRTDRELADLKVEMQNMSAYVRSLEKIRTRLTGEAEDLNRETERERQELRAKEKAARALESQAARAVADVEMERKAREAAEIQSKRYQAELRTVRTELSEAVQRASTIQKSKDALEAELTSLASDGDHQNATANMRLQYEARIADLENHLRDAHSAELIAERVKQRIDQQHRDLRRLLSTSGTKDDALRTRLLRELELADEELAQEFSKRQGLPKTTSRDSGVHTLANGTPTKKVHFTNGIHKELPASPKASSTDRQVGHLRQQVQALELQMITSDRVRKHLESSMRQLMSDLESTDGSKQSLHSSKSRLARENLKLNQLLEEEAEARRTADAAQLDGIKALWTKFQNTITDERESYSKLEESRRALVAQQRSAQADLDEHRRQVQDLTASKKNLQSEVHSLKERLEVELLGKKEEINARRALQNKLADLEAASAETSSVSSDLTRAVEAYKAQAESSLARLEAAEVERVKANRAEAFAALSMKRSDVSLSLLRKGRPRKSDSELQKGRCRSSRPDWRSPDENSVTSKFFAEG